MSGLAAVMTAAWSGWTDIGVHKAIAFGAFWLVQVVIILRYPVNGAGAIRVSSAGQFSGHADFMNAWDQDHLTYLVNYCLNALRPCGSQR